MLWPQSRYEKFLEAALHSDPRESGGGIVMVTLAFSLFIMVLVALGTKPPTPVPENSFLLLDLSMSLTDTPDQSNGALGGLLGKGIPQVGLWELTRALEARPRTEKSATSSSGRFRKGGLWIGLRRTAGGLDRS
jgi:hypothetical protein